MKNWQLAIFAAIGALLVWLGYNYYQTGNVGGTVGAVNASTDYTSLIDTLTNGLSANFLSGSEGSS